MIAEGRNAIRFQYLCIASVLAGVLVFVSTSSLASVFSPLAMFLLACMVAANLRAPVWGNFSHSGVFLCSLVAAALLGPGPATVLVALAEVGAYAFDRIRAIAALVNAVASTVPTLLVGLAIGAPIREGEFSVKTCLVMLGSGLVAALFSWITAPSLIAWHDRRPVAKVVASVWPMAFAAMFMVAPAVGIVALHLTVGWVSMVVLVVALIGYNRTAHLVVNAAVMADRAAVIAASRQRLVAQALDAEDRERRRLAERLHDEAIQSLLVAQHDLADDDPNVREKAADAVGQAIADLRGAVFDLHPAVLDHAGLAGAVQAVAEQQGRRGAFEASVEVDHAAEGLNDELAFTLARELLVNAGRHAQAANVTVRIGRRDDAVSLDVVDDGVGISDEAREQAVLRGHIGLASSRERVEVLGGSFELQTAPGEGTSVRIVIPRAQAPREVAMPETTQSILAARRPAPERPRAAT